MPNFKLEEFTISKRSQILSTEYLISVFAGTIMVDIYESDSYICELNNFDIWETEAKDCMVAVITDIVIG